MMLQADEKYRTMAHILIKCSVKYGKEKHEEKFEKWIYKIFHYKKLQEKKEDKYIDKINNDPNLLANFKCEGCKFHPEITEEENSPCKNVKFVYVGWILGYFDFIISISVPDMKTVEHFAVECIRDGPLRDSIIETQTLAGSLIFYPQNTKDYKKNEELFNEII